MSFIAENIGNLFGKSLQLNVDFDIIDHVQIVLLVLGFLFTVWTGYLIGKKSPGSETELKQSMRAVGITAAIYLVIGIKILTLPIT